MYSQCDLVYSIYYPGQCLELEHIFLYYIGNITVTKFLNPHWDRSLRRNAFSYMKKEPFPGIGKFI